MKRFRYLKPIKTKGIFYNSKNTGSMRLKENLKRTFIYAILVLISLIWLLPFIYLVLQSFAVKYSPTQIIPTEWTFNNYRALFDKSFVMKFNGKDIIFANNLPLKG